MHHPRRQNVTSMVGLKNGHIRKISPRMVNPRDKAGNKEEEVFIIKLCSPVVRFILPKEKLLVDVIGLTTALSISARHIYLH